MKKIVEINGMHCQKCSGRVEKALNDIDGIKAKVNLAKNNAVISFEKEVADDVIRNAITELGFEAGQITVKKGIFG